MYLPKKVYVKPQSRNDAATGEIVRRVHAVDPSIPVIHLKENSIPLSFPSSPVDRWQERQRSLVLAHRTVPFLTTFSSPGTVVERMGVLANLYWQCPFNCNFCYLQNVLPPDHMIYTNLGKLEHELAVEPFAYPAALTLWTIISFAEHRELLKTPANFHRAADYVRAEFALEGVNSTKMALDVLDEILQEELRLSCAD
jgi:hypothetical protein